MNFNIFVAIITCVFYVFLRIYKRDILKDKKQKSKSHFLYILFVPAVLYLTNFIFYNSKITDKDIISVNSNTGGGGNIKNTLNISEDLLSIPYPESSFRSSNLN